MAALIARASGDGRPSVSRPGHKYAETAVSTHDTACTVELWADGHGSAVVRGSHGQALARLEWPAESDERDATMRAAFEAAK